MINLDPATAEADPELMKTVVRLNDNHAGVYGEVVQPGELRMGQVVSLRGRTRGQAGTGPQAPIQSAVCPHSRLWQPAANASLCVLTVSLVFIRSRQRHQKLRRYVWMGDLDRLAPIAVFFCQLPFLFTTFSSKVNTTGVENADVRTVNHMLRLYVLDYLTHGLARPNAIRANGRIREHLADATIRNCGSAELGARLPHRRNPIHKTVSL